MLNNALPEWAALTRHAALQSGIHIKEHFAADPDRFSRFSLSVPGLLVDYSRQRISQDTIALLMDLARSCEVEQWRERMFNGEPINNTEGRAVLHTALRRPKDDTVITNGRNIIPGIHETLNRMQAFTRDVHNGTWTGHNGKRIETIINIGIGGSDLGPRMVAEALRPYHHDGIRVDFVANVDGADLHAALNRANPETTLFLVASKTFTTQETMLNAHAARQWIIDYFQDEGAIARHFVALSTNLDEVIRFGIETDNMFPFGEWVGGRYSLWSSIGLSICLAVGFDRFRDMLDGGYAMDQHFCTAPLERNAPVLLAMLGVWNRNFMGCGTHAVLPYDQSLAHFPRFLQQLDMESNGKSVTRDGAKILHGTGPVIFGEPGTNAQHAFFQLLHQGADIVPCDLIGALSPHHPYIRLHEALLANMVAQADAFMMGRESNAASPEPARDFAGNRPSNVLLLDRLTPYHLGQLISLYEHKVFVQGIIWGINSFDQYGVELGKVLAADNLRILEDSPKTTENGLWPMICRRLRPGPEAQ